MTMVQTAVSTTHEVFIYMKYWICFIKFYIHDLYAPANPLPRLFYICKQFCPGTQKYTSGLSNAIRLVYNTLNQN